MRKSIYIFGMMFLMLFTTSCLDNGGTTSTAISDEAKITSFYLYSDSIEGIDDDVFTIDNDSMLIYNYDSIDYGTRIDSLSFVLNPRFSSVYINDTLDYYNLTEVYLNFTNGVKFTVVASDEKTSADYFVKVNVHQVDPDTFIWQGVKSEVFAGYAMTEKALWINDRLLYFAIVDNDLIVNESVDGVKWESLEVSGLDIDFSAIDLRYLVGYEDFVCFYYDGELYKSADGATWTSEVITGIAVEYLLFSMEGKVFGVTADGGLARLDGADWVDLGRLPSDFPVDGAAVLVAKAPSGKERVFVVGGIDSKGKFLSTVWSSETGEYWSELSGGIERFSPRAYATLAQYGGGLMLFGGMMQGEDSESNSMVVKDAQMFSKDFGLTWGEPKAKSAISDLYVPRYGHSAVVVPNGYIYLIGGKSSSARSNNDVWRGLNYASLPGFRR